MNLNLLMDKNDNTIYVYNRPYLESAIFETCMISTFILLSFESK